MKSLGTYQVSVEIHYYYGTPLSLKACLMISAFLYINYCNIFNTNFLNSMVLLITFLVYSVVGWLLVIRFIRLLPKIQ